jgi:hypothetical protein
MVLGFGTASTQNSDHAAAFNEAFDNGLSEPSNILSHVTTGKGVPQAVHNNMTLDDRDLEGRPPYLHVCPALPTSI